MTRTVESPVHTPHPWPAAGPIVFLVAVLASVAVGWYLRAGAGGTHGVALIGELAGRVSAINESGAKLCIAPEGGGDQRCSVVYRRPDAQPLSVGDQISVAIGRLPAGEGDWIEIFIAEEPTSD
jgi:hypothetical protein